jgi:hypothetical protein
MRENSGMSESLRYYTTPLRSPLTPSSTLLYLTIADWKERYKGLINMQSSLGVADMDGVGIYRAYLY